MCQEDMRKLSTHSDDDRLNLLAFLTKEAWRRLGRALAHLHLDLMLSSVTHLLVVQPSLNRLFRATYEHCGHH